MKSFVLNPASRALGKSPGRQLAKPGFLNDYSALPFFFGDLTLSGNEITDASRLLGTQGDGLLNDSSMGIWPAATNLRLNGGAETNVTGWAAIGIGASAPVRSVAQSKFGVASVLVHVDGTSGIGVETVAISVTASNPYTEGVWVLAPNGQAMRLQLAERLIADAVDITQTNTDFVGTGAWQPVAVSKTLGATSGVEHMLVLSNSAGAPFDFYVDGSQLETGLVRTPYIETNGGTAARSVARVQGPSTVLNVTQEWFAMRLRAGFLASDTSLGSARMLGYEPDGSNRLLCYWRSTSGDFRVYRQSAGSGGEAVSAVQTFVVGDVVTVVGVWTASIVGISVNGAAFVFAANTLIPVGSTTLFDLGRDSNVPNTLRGDILWAAIGRGTLTNENAAAIHAFGNTDPQIASFPGQPTFCWDGRTSRFVRAA